MRILLTAVFTTFIIIASFGQLKKNAKINNELTSKHVNVEGTQVSLIPPAGWTHANNFNGFQQTGSNSSIMVTKFKGEYAVMSEAFTTEALKTRGVILDKKITLTINERPVTFFIARQFAYQTMFGKYILMFGDGESTFLINGMFPLDFEKELGKDVEKSMLTLIYEPNKVIDPLSNVNFEIDISNSKLKFAGAMSKMLMYTVDGLMPPEVDDKTSFMVGLSNRSIEIEDKKQYCIDRIKQLPLIENLNIDKIESITIDAISGYEIVAYGKDTETDKSKLIYQILLFSDNNYYIFVGITKDDFTENLELFKKLAKTFKRKG